MTRCSVVTFVAAAITVTFASGVAAQKVRTLRQNHQPIVSRLLPDDQVVVIEHLMGPPLSAAFYKTREIELKDLDRWEEVAVIHQARPQSFFAMNGTWLNTRVTARVVQTLKTGRLATAPGKVIEFEHEGGELDVNGVIVRSAVGVSSELTDLIRQARVIYSREGTPIASLLSKDDKFVVLRRGGVISESVNDYVPTLAEDLAWRVRDADAIAVVELDRSDSFLAEEESWIRSKLKLKVIQAIKQPTTWQFDNGGYMTVDHDGGDLTIENVRVRAGRYYEFSPNQRYLVFLRSQGPGYIGFVGIQLKVSNADRIAPIDLSDGLVATAGSPLYGLPLSQAIAEFKRRLRP